MRRTYILEQEDYRNILYDYLHQRFPCAVDRHRHVKVTYGNPPTRRHPELLVSVEVKASPLTHLYLHLKLRKVLWRTAK